MKTNKTLDVKTHIEKLQAQLGDSSDVKTRFFSGRDSNVYGCLIYLDGIVDTSTIEEHIVDPLVNKTINGNANESEFITTLMEEVIETASVEAIDTSKAISKIVEGWTVILFENIEELIAVDTAKWQERAITNPKGQRTVEGPNVGFTESRSGNVALVRKLVKNHNLRIETELFGTTTNTSVSLLYLESKVDHDILKDIKTKMSQISLDSILDSNYLSEFLTKESKSVFPLIINTERPDVVAAEVLEGRVCIIVDGSPYALIAPAELNQFFQSAEDYYLSSRATGLVRPLRFAFFWISIYVPGLYVAFTTFHAGIIPPILLVGFVSQRQAVPLPTVLEVLIVNFLIETIYEGSNRLPQSVVITISIFGAIVFGQASIEAQLIQPITLVVLSVSFILSSIIPVASMNIATRILKILLILMGALLGIYGIALFTLMLLVHLCSLRSFTVPYLAPLAPFTLKDQKDVIIRKTIPEINHSQVHFHKEETMEEDPLLSTKKENDS